MSVLQKCLAEYLNSCSMPYHYILSYATAVRMHGLDPGVLSCFYMPNQSYLLDTQNVNWHILLYSQ
jgi:hypothetical protein